MTIRPATEDDLSAIITLTKQCLGEVGDMRTEAYWRWKHIQNPFGPSPVLMAWEGDMLIGLRAFMPWRFRYQHKDVLAYRAVDTATHPDHQGKGIFSKLTLALIEQLKAGAPALIFNTPNHKSMPGYLKMGWQQVGRTRLRAKIHPLQIVKHRFSHAPVQVPSPVLFPDDLDQLLKSWQQGRAQEMTTAYSMDYLRWRYQQIPGVNYGLKTVKKGDSMAVVIYRLKPSRAISELRLVDIFYEGPEKRRVVRTALNELAETYQPDVMTTLTDAAGELDALLPFGFFKAEKRGLTITGRKVNDDSVAALLNAPQAWNLSAGTLELF